MMWVLPDGAPVFLGEKPADHSELYLFLSVLHTVKAERAPIALPDLRPLRKVLDDESYNWTPAATEVFNAALQACSALAKSWKAVGELITPISRCLTTHPGSSCTKILLRPRMLLSTGAVTDVESIRRSRSRKDTTVCSMGKRALRK